MKYETQAAPGSGAALPREAYQTLEQRSSGGGGAGSLLRAGGRQVVEGGVEGEWSLLDIQRRLYYWKLAPEAWSGLYRLPANNQYLMFETDCGGFNNIRMAFEYFVMMAWISR